MALFGSNDAAALRQLFATDELSELVWRENIDNLADGAAFVDVVVSSPRPAFLQQVYKVGLTYWPNGPVVRGVQNYTQGTSVTFAKVPVKKGATLAVAASTIWGDSLPARVDVVPSGSGASVERERQDNAANPLGDVAKSAGTVLGIAALLAIAYLVSKVD